jgi:hypothetical protein
MDQIRPWLFIGAYRDTINLAYLQLKSIGAVLQLAEKVDQPDILSQVITIKAELAGRDFPYLENCALQKARLLKLEHHFIGLETFHAFTSLDPPWRK